MNSKKRRILIFASLSVFNSLQVSLSDDYELVMQIDSNQALKDLNSYPKCFSLVIVELQSKSEINTDFFNKIKNDVPAIVINKNLNEEAIDECLKIGVSDFIDINENKNLLKNRIINAISLFEERKNSKLNESYIHEIYKNQVLASISKEIQFEYNIVTRELTFSRNGAMKLNLDNICLNPVDYSQLSNRCNLDTLNRIKSSINETTIKNPIVSLDIRVNLDKELK